MNRVFARLQNINDRDEVFAIIQEVNNIDEEWHPDYVKRLVDITELDPRPEPGWIYESGEFSPPPEPELSPREQMMRVLAGGCEIESASNPDINGTYIVTGDRWQQMRDEVLYIVSFDAFSGGVEELDWPTIDDEVTFTDPSDFKKVVRGIGDWLTKWQSYVDGKTPDPPSLPVNIA